MTIVRNAVAASLLAGALAALPGAASAAPNFIGPSGFIMTPDAMVVGAGCANVGYHYFNLDRREVIDFAPLTAPDFDTIEGNVGVTHYFEIGGTGFQLHRNDSDYRGWLNAKASPLPAKSPVQIAGGVIDALQATRRTEYAVLGINVGHYMPHQRDLPRTLRLGGGWGTGGVVDGWFANGGLRIGPHIELMAEWVEHENRSFIFGDLPGGDLESKPGRVNVGARFRVPGARGLALDVAGIGVEESHPILAGGISYTYCMPKRRHEEEGKGKGEGPKGGVEPPPVGPQQKSEAAPSLSPYRARQGGWHVAAPSTSEAH